MPKYVGLYNWTDQGAANAKDTIDRARAFRELVEGKGGRADTILWTAGAYDVVAVLDLPDDETVSALHLQLASTGNIRSTTMRAFDENEMSSIIDKMG